MRIDDIFNKPPGALITSGVSEEEYLDKYAEHFCEWINGTIIRIAPETLRHGETVGYLYILLKIYCELNPIAQVIGWLSCCLRPEALAACIPFILRTETRELGRHVRPTSSTAKEVAVAFSWITAATMWI